MPGDVEFTFGESRVVKGFVMAGGGDSPGTRSRRSPGGEPGLRAPERDCCRPAGCCEACEVPVAGSAMYVHLPRDRPRRLADSHDQVRSRGGACRTPASAGQRPLGGR